MGHVTHSSVPNSGQVKLAVKLAHIVHNLNNFLFKKALARGLWEMIHDRCYLLYLGANLGEYPTTLTALLKTVTTWYVVQNKFKSLKSPRSWLHGTEYKNNMTYTC